MKKNISIRELGYNGDHTAMINEFGCYEWETEDTFFEYDPETEKERHCGKGSGCFWTDWR